MCVCGGGGGWGGERETGEGGSGGGALCVCVQRGVYLLLLHFQRKTSLGITNCNSPHVIHTINTAISTFIPFGSLSSNGMIMCVCVRARDRGLA